eukprot:4403256-Amphidinium_carterae.1
MFLNQPRQQLLTGGAALASSIKDSRHNSIEKEAQRISCWCRAILPKFGSLLGAEVSLHVCKHWGGGDAHIHTHRQTSKVVEDGVGSVRGPRALSTAHGLNVDSLLNAGQQACLPRKSN